MGEKECARPVRRKAMATDSCRERNGVIANSEEEPRRSDADWSTP